MQISLLHNASWSCKCFLQDLGHYQFDWAWFGQGQTTWTLPLYLMFLHHTSVHGCLSNHSFWNTNCLQKLQRKYVSLQDILRASAKSNTLFLICHCCFYLISFYLLSTYCAETWAGVGLFFVWENIIFVYLSCFNLLGWNWEPISSAFTSDLIRRCNSLKQECQLRWLSLMKLCHSHRAHVQKRIWIMLAGNLDITGEF